MLLDIKQVDKSRLKSNVLKEYLAFKEENAEAILLFQIGGFWETFFHDAKIFSEITGVTLGTRKIKDTGEILQAGIPLHTLNLYIKKILNEDYKVCLCAQFQNDDNEFYREIIRTYTKGTIIENEFLDSTENNYIALIYKEQDICVDLVYQHFPKCVRKMIMVFANAFVLVVGLFLLWQSWYLVQDILSMGTTTALLSLAMWPVAVCVFLSFLIMIPVQLRFLLNSFQSVENEDKAQ